MHRPAAMVADKDTRGELRVSGDLDGDVAPHTAKLVQYVPGASHEIQDHLPLGNVPSGGSATAAISYAAGPLASLEHGLSVTAARFSPDGARILTTCNDNLLRVRCCRDGRGVGGGGEGEEAAVGEKHIHHRHVRARG